MTTLIKNIILVDGTGKNPFKADVLVRDRSIVAVGSFPSFKADKVILGNEGYLMPGFVDLNVSSDRYLTLFTSPLHRDFLLQGVTSILIGQCGFSLAPSFYGALGHCSAWTSATHVNVNWKRVGDFLDVLQKQFNFGVNIATLAGHRVIRDEMVHNPSVFRSLTANELRVFRSVLDEALREGAFGLSVGLGHYPYQSTPYHELRALLDVVKKYNGVYATHMRNEKEGILASVQETVKLAQEVAVPTIISHLRPFVGFEHEYRDALSLIEEKSAKADVYFNINPFSYSAESVASFIPEKFRNDSRDVLVEKFKDPACVKEITSLLPKFDSTKMMILNAPGMEFLVGKTLYEFARNRQLSAPKALIELMRVSKLRAVVFFDNLNEQEVSRALLSGRSLISTNSPNFDHLSVAFKPERSYNTFPTYLKHAAASSLSIEQAVAKISGLPATLVGLKKRGLVTNGYYADMVLTTKDFEVSAVLVNGTLMIDQGSPTHAQGSGTIMRRCV
ncbi:MAG: amidohydrolase family protein [Candidatus Pacebacteria bacterium]|nr:amidohydrolase family protein [Candidatus Paceibacterota bacterium]